MQALLETQAAKTLTVTLPFHGKMLSRQISKQRQNCAKRSQFNSGF